MTDLKNSVILPREDFIELQEAAFIHNHVPTAGERVATTIQTTSVMMGIGGVVVAATWGCYKAADWLEERRLKRLRAEHEIDTKK